MIPLVPLRISLALVALGSFTATAQILETKTIALASQLEQLDGAAAPVVDALDLEVPGDGGGGRFVWIPKPANQTDGALTIAAKDTSGHWKRHAPGQPLNVRWFGARGDGASNDGPAIQRAIDAAGRAYAENRSVTLFFPPGNYHVKETLQINQGPLTLQGEKAQSSRIFYSGAEYKDLLSIKVTPESKHRHIKIFDLTFNGGGRARYCIYGENFTRGCQIQRSVIRGGVGLIKLVGCWYADVSYNDIRSVAPAPKHLTPEQIAEVHGPASAPVYFSGGGASSFDRNIMCELALAPEMPVATARSIFISSSGSSFSNNSIENVWKGKSPLANGIPNVLLEIKGTVGVDDLYLEKTAAKDALIQADRATIDGALIYNARAATLFLATGPQDLVVRNSFIRRVMADELFRVANPQLASGRGATVIFDNCSILTGERSGGDQRSATLVYDHRATGYNPLGMQDPAASGRREPALVKPAVVDGYQVRLGKDAHGPLVEVAGGIFRTEEGRTVVSKELQILDGVEAVSPDLHQPLEGNKLLACRPQVLRFPPNPAGRANRWYRVYVGKAGQPFLRVYASEPREAHGNWLSEFKLEPGDRFSAARQNPSLEAAAGKSDS